MLPAVFGCFLQLLLCQRQGIRGSLKRLHFQQLDLCCWWCFCLRKLYAWSCSSLLLRMPVVCGAVFSVGGSTRADCKWRMSTDGCLCSADHILTLRCAAVSRLWSFTCACGVSTGY
ncbi:hypothetical protein COO60DRAFT_109219 [Scenedesmus sp. NREL 46B-D3]|nr:hypothetical protein COO60DRAFT_109219 [Scenedesmus sp. NREL 46B-D3]